MHVAGRIAEALRGYDTLARWGGEEFVILLPGFAGRDDLLSAGERVREAVEDRPGRDPRLALPAHGLGRRRLGRSAATPTRPG